MTLFRLILATLVALGFTAGTLDFSDSGNNADPNGIQAEVGNQTDPNG